uniref:Tumor susceptibility 101a n=1 Tax=Paramormyrops kingsleyae TaxID=1676925 RepID=A0A3B3R356_9TELE
MAVVNEGALKKMLSKQYKYRDLTVREIINVISHYKDLKPVMDAYVFNDGSSRDLMSLTGTVPVSYKGNVYNIPVCLWLLDTYPFNPPICFVKPTSTMMIRTGKHIDANGKIYLPYLHEWKHPQSDLYGLIQVMIVVFGEEPPVFSRPTAQAPYQAFQAAGPPNTSYMPGMPTVSPYGSGIAANTSGYPGYPYPSGNSYPGAAGPGHYGPQPPVTTVGPSRDGTIGEDTIRASLISAVSDKLRWRMKEEMDRAQAELDALKRTEEDLKKGHQKLEDMVSRLDQEVTDVDRNIELLKHPQPVRRGECDRGHHLLPGGGAAARGHRPRGFSQARASPVPQTVPAASSDAEGSQDGRPQRPLLTSVTSASLAFGLKYAGPQQTECMCVRKKDHRFSTG